MQVQHLLAQVKTKIEEASNKEGFSGVPSGFDEIDEITDGWQGSELITIGARAGMGKTSFALSMARNIAVNKNSPLLFFSLETSSYNFINKLISLETGFSLQTIKKGSFERHQLEKFNASVRRLHNVPMFIDDSPSLSIENLVLKVKEVINNNELTIIIIDYLQLLTINKNKSNAVNREQEVSIIVKKLKSLSKELDIPIILLSQLNRALEDRLGSKRPVLKDLRDSGAIEDDSDMVCFLYRPEYYKIEEWDDEDRFSTDGQAEFIIAKNRNGDLKNVRLNFNKNIGEFQNLDDFNFSSDNFKASPDQAFGSSFNDDDNDVPF